MTYSRVERHDDTIRLKDGNDRLASNGRACCADNQPPTTNIRN